MLFAQEISGETGVQLLRVVSNFYGEQVFSYLLVSLVSRQMVPGILDEGEVPFLEGRGVSFEQVSGGLVSPFLAIPNRVLYLLRYWNSLRKVSASSWSVCSIGLNSFFSYHLLIRPESDFFDENVSRRAPANRPSFKRTRTGPRSRRGRS